MKIENHLVILEWIERASAPSSEPLRKTQKRRRWNENYTSILMFGLALGLMNPQNATLYKHTLTYIPYHTHIHTKTFEVYFLFYSHFTGDKMEAQKWVFQSHTTWSRDLGFEHRRYGSSIRACNHGFTWLVTGRLYTSSLLFSFHYSDQERREGRG